jgi:Flp pilus assembly protein TadB
MPIHLPHKARAKAAPARTQAAAHAIDWLGLWALSVAFCAIVLAGIAYFMIGDNTGASCILVGAAAIIAIVVRFGTDRDEARDEN